MLHWPHRLITAVLLTVFLFILIASLAFAYLIVSPLGGKILARYFLQQCSSMALMHVGHYQGTLNEGFVLSDVEARGLPYVPDALARIQKIQVQVPLWDLQHPDLDILNARIFVPGCDTMVFSGRLYNGRVRGNLYAKSVDVHAIGRFLNDGDLKQYLEGFVSNIDLFIQGSITTPTVIGHFLVDDLHYKSIYLKDGMPYLNVVLFPHTTTLEMIGQIRLDSGLLIINGVQLQMTKSAVYYQQDMLNPRLDLHASSKIEDTDIHLVLTGTAARPQLDVTSNPPLPPQDALCMLFTGNAWSAPSQSPFGKATKSEMAQDFLKYSGLNSRDQRNFGFQKKLTNRLKLGLAVDQGADSSSSGNTTTYYSRKVNGKMDVSRHLSVNVSQGVLPPDKDQTTLRSQHDSETQVYLQYKKNF